MAVIHPFRACRYDQRRYPDLDAVVSPPYDIISMEERRRLASYSPYNVIHVTLSEEGVNASGEGPFYSQAARTIAQWRSEGHVRVDSAPAIYLLRHRFLTPQGDEGRRDGFFALTDLKPFEDGIVRPHEKTYPGPIKDRLALMTACEASESAVWFLYRDPVGGVMSLLWDAAQRQRPAQRFKMGDGQNGELYVLPDPGLHAELARRLADGHLLIADGHHRYTTTLAYHETSLGRRPGPRIFGYFSALESPDLLLLATHRGLCGLDDYDETALAKRLAEDFDLLPLGGETLPAEAFQGLNFVWCRQDGTDCLLVLNDKGRAHLSEQVPESILAGLDVSAFRELVLRRALSLDEQELKRGGQLRFYPSEALGRLALERGDLQGLFIMRPLPPATLGAITDAGLVTPQKTTYFFPKVPSGLLWHRFAED